MKWYSVNSYRIPANSGLLLVGLKIDELFTYKLAEYTHDIETDKFCWMDERGNKIMNKVTHFCIPDPIEIEE